GQIYGVGYFGRNRNCALDSIGVTDDVRRHAVISRSLAMWIVSKPFSLVGFVAGLAGILAVAAGSQLQFLFTAAVQTPHARTVMEVSDNGTSGNAHVELTGFKFGKPVIEKGPHDEWIAVWLPLDRVPETAKPLRRPVYFHTTHLHDQAALNEFVKQKRLRLLV